MAVLALRTNPHWIALFCRLGGRALRVSRFSLASPPP